MMDGEQQSAHKDASQFGIESHFG